LHWGKLNALFDDGSVDVLEDGNFFSSHVDVHKGVDDLIMLKHIFRFLEKSPQPFLLVVQMDGSHYPYNEHSPDSLKRFLPEKTPNCINAFDNTLVVTDIYLTRLYQYLTRNFPGTFMFFTPDHGQNFGGLNGRFNDNFTRDIFHNALIAFPPSRDSVSYRLLMKNEKQMVSQADIFATMLALMKGKPQFVIDGVSLMDTTKRHRVITCSEYMPTFHNNPAAVVVDSAMQTRHIDFSRMSVTDSETGRVYPYRKLPSWIRKVIDYRLQRKRAERVLLH
jgi:arylsulfatase A-like enzyme